MSFNASQFIHHLYQSVTTQQGWQQVLPLMADALQAEHIILGKTELNNSVELSSARVDTDHLSVMQNTWENSPLQSLIANGPAGLAFEDSELFDHSELISSDYFQEVVRPMQGYYALMGIPFRSNNNALFISACRSQRKGAFNRQAKSHLQLLLPHIATASQLQEQLALASPQRLLDRVDSAVILIDHRQHIIAVNDCAGKLLALNDGLTVEKKLLSACTPARTNELRRALKTATGATSLSHANFYLRLARPSGLPGFCLRIIPINKDSPWYVVPNTAAAIWINAIDTHQMDKTLLARLFELTPRETDLAAILAEGCSLRESAKIMGVGIATIRTHLNALFAKTGTRRQAELVSLLLRSAWRI